MRLGVWLRRARGVGGGSPAGKSVLAYLLSSTIVRV